MNKTLDLNGSWQLRWFDGERGERPNRVRVKGADWRRAWMARVPGSVHETLLEHGVIPDPCLGANVLACRWVEETVWYYRRTFEASKLRAGEQAWIVFETLDLAAKIFLNGVEIGSHANAFYPCRLDATKALREGVNDLVVEVESGLFRTMDRSADGLGLRMNHRLTKMPWARKTQSQHGWDWSPRLINVGIPGNVRLEVFSGIRMDRLVVLTKVSEDFRTGTVTARVFAENPSSKDVRAELMVSVKGTKVSRKVPVTLKPGMNTIETDVEVQKPSLWWPVGHGSQKRYSVSAELRVDGKVAGQDSRKVGFRHVRINQDTHPKEGLYFVVEINGKPIFCKGGNYVPTDLILSRVDRKRHADLIDLALESNCNFLRVWGGGVYEDEDFYDLCDERGILVWQDFIFACVKYPTIDEAFLADVTREVTHQVRRLAHHPSLVIWCGNNEMEVGAWNWGFDKGMAHPDYALFHLVIPRLLKAEDPVRFYQPSSPFSPDHQPPNADHLGDQHPWDIGFWYNDFRKYREMICRFPNEGGILGPNSLPTLRAALSGGPEKIGSFAWKLHDNSVSSWDNIPAYTPDLMLEQWLGRRVDGMTLEDFVYWGGVLQGAGLAEYIKNFRRRMFDSAAAIFWMFNDIWPCSRSWTIVDSGLRRTPAFWPVRRAFAPVTVVVTHEGDTVRVHGVNEGAQISAHLRFGLMALAGKYPFDQSIPVTLPGNASTVLAEFPAARWDRLGVKNHLAFAVLTSDAGEIARDALMLPLFREMKWPKPQVRIAMRAGQAVFTSNTFAWRVCLDLDGDSALPDNFFDIYPGIPTVLPWPQSLGKPKILRIGNAL